MGTVWRAHDELLGRHVAVKELHPEGGAPATAALREARAVAQIKHPHVIVVHDVVEETEPDPASGAKRSYIVMELVDGGSLADRLASAGPVEVREAARIGVALLGALATAHARGVLHRDLKPANVLIEEDSGRVVLTDFGIAQVPGTSTISEEGAFVGSPEYTAPERMQGAGAGPESDLWSLGALLCAALSGESPFHRDSLGGVLHAVVLDEIRPPTAAGPLLPVVHGLLERDPAQRLGAVEAESLLRTFAATGSTPRPRYVPTERVTPELPPADAPPATPVTAPSPIARPWRARGVLVGAALVIVLAGAGAALAVLTFGGAGTDRSAAEHPSPSAAATVAFQPPPQPPPPPPPPRQGPPPVPDGFHVVRDPNGFALALPDGYVRSTDSQRVFYQSPGGAVRIGIRLQNAVAGGPLGVMKLAAANGPLSNPGYRDGKVIATTHHGRDAALWEFTWNGFTKAEGARHTYDVCWDDFGRMYDVWVSAPVSRLDEAKRTFDTALDSFRPGP
ncbi:serine/threonine protein kinase [Streptomyces sp. ASQP_92]|uniref:serine/threonine-protein kinase n=1 Tax=Streptomyces sp. ASQP_92 TaxID=2979116 RepID=UPI0021BE3784|nr:serine/threonine-protein kinase [Streptomyces sp. ASQP_92]MCT9089356.1 serine/threonine protein kinase [Streptomyces sp. ASQP_92]